MEDATKKIFSPMYGNVILIKETKENVYIETEDKTPLKINIDKKNKVHPIFFESASHCSNYFESVARASELAGLFIDGNNKSRYEIVKMSVNKNQKVISEVILREINNYADAFKIVKALNDEKKYVGFPWYKIEEIKESL